MIERDLLILVQNNRKKNKPKKKFLKGQLKLLIGKQRRDGKASYG